jgi:Uma2 family endonuclease
MTVMPRDHEWTVADLENTPDDGLRYELVDGVLLVSAAPSQLHQIVLAELYVLLRAAAAPETRVMFAPTDFQPTQSRSLQPDLLVVRRSDLGGKAITEPLLLAVEVLSPSTRSVDLLLKRGVYVESGVEAYWVVDPFEPSIQAWTLVDGDWVDAGRSVGDDELVLEVPFAVRVRPSALLN